MPQNKEGIISIHGREYFTVARRVGDFRKTHKAKDGWAIVTELMECNDTFVLVRASVIDPESRVVAVGHAEEFRAASRINKTSAVENAETSAVGRCLAAFGMSGSGEYASANEIEKAKRREASLESSSRQNNTTTSQKLEQWRTDGIKKIIGFSGTEDGFYSSVLAAKPGATHPKEMDKATFEKAVDWYIRHINK